MDGDDYWNISHNKSFSFDDDIVDDDVSEISIVSQSSGNLSLDMIISDSDLQLILEDQMMSDLVLPKVPLEEEVKILRRKLQETQFCSVQVTINKLLLGKPCSLSIYKSFNEKEELLDKAIKSGDGNAIMQIIIFLKNSLKTSLFLEILKSYPEAVNHYVNFLSTTQKISEAIEILNFVGRTQESAILQFKTSISSKNVMSKLDQLKKIKDLFLQTNCNPFLSQQVINYTNLLEMQINERLYYQPHDILEKSVIETLYHSCEKFNKWSDPTSVNSITNPFKIVENYSITPAQFEWIAINERGKSQAWRDIETLFEKKSVLKKKTFVIHIPLELTILRLHQLRAPQAVLNSFLQHLDDPERRLALSKKVGAINSIVESLVQLKDRIALEEFKESLPNGTPEYYNAEKAITSLSQTKSLLGLRKNSNTNHN